MASYLREIHTWAGAPGTPATQHGASIKSVLSKQPLGHECVVDKKPERQLLAGQLGGQ